ncbi:hypothetical protein GCM10027422_29890 [Hymenobacter arcticus]
MEIYNSVEQSEYIYTIAGPAYIEPVAGWIFDKHKKEYSLYSFPYSELQEKPSFVAIKLKPNKEVKVDKIISIQYYFKNYWHFLNDVLGQLAYLNQAGFATDIPVLVPAGSLAIPYIKAAISRSSKLRNRTWIEQHPDVMVQANTVIVAKNLPNTKANFLNILDLLDVAPLAPDAATTGRKIFVKRGSNRGRRLANIQEVEALMLAEGFEVIDNDLLSFDEQVALYRQASFVVGIHGAGLVNLIFRASAPLRLVELFPENVIPPHYYWLCHELGFDYDCLVGEKAVDEAFYLNPQQLKATLSA